MSTQKSQIINNTEKNTRCRLFKIQGFLFHNNPEAEAQRRYVHAALNYKTGREHARNFFGLLPQGYCEQNKTNLEKTTSSFLLVLLLNYNFRDSDNINVISNQHKKVTLVETIVEMTGNNICFM